MKEKDVFLKHECPRNSHLFQNCQVDMTLSDDLDFGNKGRVLPQGIYMKYESSITYHSKAMAKVKVFADKQTNKQTNGQTDRGTNGQANTYMPPIYRCRGIKKLEENIP